MRRIEASLLPWYYAPWWLLISTPPVVLIGLLLSLTLWQNRSDAFQRLALWFTALLPLTLLILLESTIYDGIRHLLFVYPILVALSAGGWSAILLDGSHPSRRRAAAWLLAAGLASILSFHVRFHPNQTVYFNALVGGPRGAFTYVAYWRNRSA